MKHLVVSFLVLVLSVMLLACSSTPSPADFATPSAVASVASLAPSTDADTSALVARACLDSTDEHCADTMRDALTFFASGSFVAVCDYGDGTGDVVLLDKEDEDEAESRCSADGQIVPSRVVTIVQLP